MNTDRNPNFPSDNYFLFEDSSDNGSGKLGREKKLSDDENLAKMAPSYPQLFHHQKPSNSNPKQIDPMIRNQEPKNLYPQLSVPNPCNITSQNFIGQGFHSTNQPLNQVVYHQNLPQKFSKSTKRIHIVVEGADQKDSIMYGQTVPCQKCGLVSDGPLNLHKGRTVCAWGTCLFMFTGIFCFLPCLIDKCKDTWISCPRCGHEKVVVKSGCCC